jgi:hypothetical protein
MAYNSNVVVQYGKTKPEGTYFSVGVPVRGWWTDEKDMRVRGSLSADNRQTSSFVSEDGTKHTGQWIADNKQFVGIVTTSDGSTYKGKFNPKKVRIVGYWENEDGEGTLVTFSANDDI